MSENARKVEHRDVVIVGAGLAGLGAATQLPDRDVLILEAAPRPGGRIRTLRKDPYWLNLGAHIVADQAGVTWRTAVAHGLELIQPQGAELTVAMGGRVVRADRLEELPFRLPLSLDARLSLARMGIRARLAHRRVARAELSDELRSEDLRALDSLTVDRALDDMTIRQLVGRLHPDVEALLRVSVNRSGGELDDESAHYAIRTLFIGFAVRHGNIVGGTERLVEALLAYSPAEVRLSTIVTAVRQDGNGVVVECSSQDGPHVVCARSCIVTIPAPSAAKIAGGIPSWKSDALNAIRYAPFVVAGMFTHEAAAMPWDDIYAMAVPKASFCMFFNPANAVRNTSPRQPGGALVVYMAGDRARPLLQASNQEVTDRYLRDLRLIFPEAADIVDDVEVARWELGVPTPGPGRAKLQPALVASCGAIHFAGDYLQYPGVDSALRSGIRAGRTAAQSLT